MTATFEPMARQTEDAEGTKKKVPVASKVEPWLKEPLDTFGKRLRALGVHGHGQGGESNAIEGILEMASYMEWFDNPEAFAAELLKFRAAAMSARVKPTKK